MSKKKEGHFPHLPNQAVVYGVHNLDYVGSKSASEAGSVKGDLNSAISDFVQQDDSVNDGLETIENAQYDTALEDIDFSEYTIDEPYEEYGTATGSEAAVTRIYVNDDNNLTFEEDWEDNPQSSIAHVMGLDSDEEGLQSAIPEKAYEIYDEEMKNHLTTGNVIAEPESLEYDYQRWIISTTVDMEEDGDTTIGSVWDQFAHSANTFNYRIDPSVQSTIKERIESETDYGYTLEASRGLSDAGYDDMDPDDITTFVGDARALGHDDPESVRTFSENFINGGHGNLDQIDESIEEYINDEYGGPESLGIDVDESSDKPVGTQIREYYENKPEITTSDPFEISSHEDRYYIHRVF